MTEVHISGVKAPDFHTTESVMNPFTGVPYLSYDGDHGYLKVVENVFHFFGPDQQYETVHRAACLTGYEVEADDKTAGEGSTLLHAALGGMLFGAEGAVLGVLLTGRGHSVPETLTLTLYFSDGIETRSGNGCEVIDFLLDADPENPGDMEAVEEALRDCVGLLHRVLGKWGGTA